MQNIIEICKEYGLEVPADKQSEFTKKVAENYLTKAEHEKKIGKLETDRDTWKEKAETAENTLKGFEDVDLETMRKDLADWKQKAEDAEKSAQAQIYERDFSDALKAELESVKFSSEAAKRDVMSQIKAAELKLKDGKILGLSDLIEQIKKDDASAFVDEAQQQNEANRARFTQPAKPGTGARFGAKTREEIEGMTNKADRQRAIAENLSLFQNQ